MQKIKTTTKLITKKTSEAIQYYFNEIHKKYKKSLTQAEEIELFTKFQNDNCQISREKLICYNLRYVISAAKHYHKGTFLELDDLIEYGNLGLIRALETFDLNREYKFITYANWWIKQAILKGIMDDSKIIRQPSMKHILNIKYLKEKNRFFNEFGFDPTIGDIADELGIELTAPDNKLVKDNQDKHKVESFEMINDNNFMSIYDSDSEEEDPIYQKLASDNEDLDEFVSKNSIKKGLSKLSQLQKLVVEYTYGLNDRIPCTFSNISDILKEQNIDLSENRIEKIHDKSLKLLKNDL